MVHHIDIRPYLATTIRFYDECAEEYIENTEGLQDIAWLNRFCDLLGPRGKVLDVGCAFGRDTSTFVARGYEAYGIDLSERMIQLAKKRVPGSKFFVMNLLSVEFADGFFDGIWCSAVFVHISKMDTSIAFDQLRRVLKKGGLLYISAKRGEGEGLVQDSRYGGAEKFYAYYTKMELARFLTRYGFSAIEWKTAEGDPASYRESDVIYVIAQKKGGQVQIATSFQTNG